MSENREFERFGDTFWCGILCLRCAARTAGHEFEFYKWLVELTSGTEFIPCTGFRESAGKV